MNTKQLKPAKTGSAIYPIKENVDMMESSAWILALICLWPYSALSPKETDAAKKHIRRFIHNVPDPYKAYLEFCQRILLTRKQMISDPGYTIPVTAADWLDPENEQGFPASLTRFILLQDSRKTQPVYKLELKALAEAILEMSEEPGPDHFNYWVNWFRERQAYDEHTIFTMFIAYDHFNKKPAMKTFPNRLVLHIKDVMLIMGKSESTARRLLRRIRKHFNRVHSSGLSVADFCSFTGFTEEKVSAFLH